MTIQFLDISTLTPELVERLKGDIRKRIMWAEQQMKTIERLKISSKGKQWFDRIELYENVIWQYQADISNIEVFLREKV